MRNFPNIRTNSRIEITSPSKIRIFWDVLFGVHFLMLKGIVSAFKTTEISTTSQMTEASGSATMKPQLLQKHVPLAILLKTVYCVMAHAFTFGFLLPGLDLTADGYVRVLSGVK